jgi:hypothetical protein
MKEFKTRERKELIRVIRIILECALCKGKAIKIIFCHEIDYLIFEFFSELLIKIVIYHKN